MRLPRRIRLLIRPSATAIRTSRTKRKVTAASTRTVKAAARVKTSSLRRSARRRKRRSPHRLRRLLPLRPITTTPPSMRRRTTTAGLAVRVKTQKRRDGRTRSSNRRTARRALIRKALLSGRVWFSRRRGIPPKGRTSRRPETRLTCQPARARRRIGL